MTKTSILSGTALATLLLLAHMDGARAQVFASSDQSDVEVNLEALNALPSQDEPAPSRPVRLHPAYHAHRQVARGSEYADTTITVGSEGTEMMALETPAAPAATASAAAPHTHVHHHRRRHAVARNEDGDMHASLAALTPAILTAADLNRLQILCAEIPTGSHPNGPLSTASYTPSPMPQAPEASIEAIPAGSPKDTTKGLNSSELAQTDTPPETLGPANIPAPANIPEPPAPDTQAMEAQRPAPPQPVPAPDSANVQAPPPPVPTDSQVAALPEAPPTPAAPTDTPRATEVSAVAPAPSPEGTPAPLSNADLRVDFPSGGAVVPAEQMQKLDKVVGRLTADQDLRIELRAFAVAQDSPSRARRVSLARALAIKSYLTSRGVNDDRIDIRALGASGENPGDRVDLFLMR